MASSWTESPGEGDRGYELLTIHGLSWLTAGNAVGLLLATLLLFPGPGDLLVPLSFGRWVPVHLNLQLYGWCALVMIGLLFRIFTPRAGAGRLPELAVGLWSGGLVFAVVSWLAGRSDGKLFLEFSGAARVVLAAVSAVLEIVLVIAFVRQLRERASGPGAAGRRWIVAAKAALLAGLAAVAPVLYWAAGTAVYPPINPDSGGATGGSLLGSTLVVVGIVLACLLVAGLRPRGGTREMLVPVALLAAHTLGFALLDHADHSNQEWLQVVSLSSLVIWIPVLGSRGSGCSRMDWEAPLVSTTRPEAAEAYRRCLALDAANEDALINLAVADIETGQLADARAQLDELLRLRPDHAQAHLTYGVLLYRYLKDPAGAREHWTRFLALAPDHPQAAEIRRVLGAGRGSGG